MKEQVVSCCKVCGRTGPSLWGRPGDAAELLGASDLASDTPHVQMSCRPHMPALKLEASLKPDQLVGSISTAAER
jgi:hypothetical protein